MKIEYVVMQGNPLGNFSVFDGLRIDNNFLTEEAAEAAIEHYFTKLPRDLLSSSDFLFVLKIFKSNR